MRSLRPPLIVLLAGLTPSVWANDVVIHTGHLIDGAGAGTRDNVSILVKDDRITGVQDGFPTRLQGEH